MVFLGKINVLTKELGNIKHKYVVAYYGEWVNWYWVYERKKYGIYMETNLLRKRCANGSDDHNYWKKSVEGKMQEWWIESMDEKMVYYFPIIIIEIFNRGIGTCLEDECSN